MKINIGNYLADIVKENTATAIFLRDKPKRKKYLFKRKRKKIKNKSAQF
ncbi:hypothetical protein [Malaciobacter mytili]|nr:hypothetical protein [Malaciobacter mytili]